jgi:hypothetical protein
MAIEFIVEYDLSNGTKVLVNKINDQTYDFHLTRLNSMKHNFTWTENKGISDAETATALPRESFTQEESEALAIFQKMKRDNKNV